MPNFNLSYASSLASLGVVTITCAWARTCWTGNERYDAPTVVMGLLCCFMNIQRYWLIWTQCSHIYGSCTMKNVHACCLPNKCICGVILNIWKALCLVTIYIRFSSDWLRPLQRGTEDQQQLPIPCPGHQEFKFAAFLGPWAICPSQLLFHEWTAFNDCSLLYI